MLNGLMAIPAMISGLTGGNYTDGIHDIMRNPGIPPKQYGQTLAMRHRAKHHKAKRKGKRKK
ncbi:MAG: hypothetical protein IJ694_04940 [Acidaminococcaceae bacterium]|nr:hypothetical protein [Acidaminococcaceae bacterium]MBR1661602.1 hypothetical protein [Acidaminococcaceae bacterium]